MTIENLISTPSYKEKFVLQKIICYFLDYTKEEMWINASQELSPEDEKRILETYHDVADNNKPLEYALGFVEFFKRKFHVDVNTLIPRPETEYMITAVTQDIDAIREKNWETGEIAICKLDDTTIWNEQSCHILMDIGTWCGVLGISVLLQNPCFFKRAIFSDISEKALAVAQQNYELQIKDHDFPVEFIKSDLLSFYESPGFKKWNCNIVLVANLPYIPEKIFAENAADNVKKREPKMAFVGGDDWLIYYRIMFDQILAYGIWVTADLRMFLEMMTWQVDILRQEYKEHFVFEEVKTFHFNIRIVKTTLVTK